jgi:adenosylcobinamide-phosphate synthase
VVSRGPWIAAGLLADRLVGELPAPVHPVARFGEAMNHLERVLWADSRLRGALYAGIGLGGAALVGLALGDPDGPGLALATFVASAGRSLLDEADAVGAALRRGDLAGARARLPALVGRDTEGLDADGIARAVVESVAENLSDAVVGTVVWGLLGGAAGVAVHRAANTLDAMVGRREARYERFGWAAARSDDLLGWPAARVTACLVALAAPARARGVLAAVRSDAPAHPSPNAGVAEAAFAGALGVRLGGPLAYAGRAEIRPNLGSGPVPTTDDLDAAIALARRVIGLCALLLALPALVRGVLRRARR